MYQSESFRRKLGSLRRPTKERVCRKCVRVTVRKSVEARRPRDLIILAKRFCTRTEYCVERMDSSDELIVYLDQLP